MVVVIDEGFDLSFEITRQEVVFQQDAVLQGLMPTFDLALGLGMIRRTARVLHAFVLQPFSQVPRDVAGTVVAEQTRLVERRGPDHNPTLQSQSPTCRSRLVPSCWCKASTR